MEQQLTFNGQPFFVGQKVYIIRKERFFYTQEHYLNHTAVFKSEISEINLDKKYFRVKSLKKNWEEFYFNLDENVCSFIKRIDSCNNFGNSGNYTVYPITSKTIELVNQIKKENHISMRVQIDNLLNDYKKSFSKMNTRYLLSQRQNFYSGYWIGKFGDLFYSMVKEELSTREHIPNKKESKILRRQSSIIKQ